MNLHQNIEEILRAASPEQRLIWNEIFLMMGERAPVKQLAINYTSTGHETLVYSAEKMYFAYELDVVPLDMASSVTLNQTNVQDITNNARFRILTRIPYWDATAAAVRYTATTSVIKNIFFSRLEVSEVCFIYFKGFKIGS